MLAAEPGTRCWDADTEVTVCGMPGEVEVWRAVEVSLERTPARRLFRFATFAQY